MKKSTLIATLLLTLSISQSSYAGNLFKITNRGSDCLTTSICDALEQLVNQSLPDANTLNFLPEMADAAILANKGLTVDYASNPEVFVLGAGIGVGLDPGETNGNGLGDGNATLPSIGLGGTISLGANMGMFLNGKFWDRSMAYINYFSYSLTTGSVKGEISSFGLHYQFKLMTPQDFLAGLIKWGGLDVSTGLETSSTKINTNVAVNQTATVGGVGTATYNGIANVGADISATSLPIEITTNARIAYFLTVYGGLAFDLNSGSSKSIANISGPVTLGGGATGGGTATLDLGKEEGPGATTLRSIIGIQVNVIALRVFAQKMASIGKNDEQISLGVRFAW